MVWSKITRYYPFNTPRASLLKFLPKIPKQCSEFVGKAGLRYQDIWSTDDLVCRSLYWFGDFDPWVNDALRRLASPDSVAIDIGANIGATALVLAQSVGRNGRVFCFEPMPGNASKLRHNLSANNFSWASVDQIALSDEIGEAAMFEEYGGAGTARITSHGTKVRTTTFDTWISSKSVGEISVCKIDVEGHEDRVFKGMATTLSTKRIRSFVLERHNVNPAAPFTDPVLRLLSNCGYEILRIEKDILSTRIRPVTSSVSARLTSDFVALLPSENPEDRS